jgi:hypothetical protein
MNKLNRKQAYRLTRELESICIDIAEGLRAKFPSKPWAAGYLSEHLGFKITPANIESIVKDALDCDINELCECSKHIGLPNTNKEVRELQSRVDKLQAQVDDLQAKVDRGEAGP